MSVRAKQWKQQLQYELQGRDYESLIYTSQEDIPILPFYTAENVKSDFAVTIHSEVAVSLFVSSKEETLKRIDFWEEQSVHFFLLSLHREVNKEEVLQWLPERLSYLFSDEVMNDTSLYQNAGATMVQQIALGISQIKELAGTLKSPLFIKVAVGEAFLLEIAKLRAFRRVLTELLPQLTIHFITEVSDRGLSLLKSSYNQNYVQLAYEASVLGGADYILPKNALFFKKNTLSKELNNVSRIQKIVHSRNASLLNGAYAIETLSYEMFKKALTLIAQIDKEGGFEAIKGNNALERQIKAKAQEEQQYFNAQYSNLPIEQGDLYSRKEWDFYPFANRNIVRLWEPIERIKTEKLCKKN